MASGYSLLAGMLFLSLLVSSSLTRHQTSSRIRSTGNGTQTRAEVTEPSHSHARGTLGCREYRLPPSGEEDMVSWVLSNFPQDFKGTFVEMGANNGLNSNTVGLEQRGWTGLCIEPAPENFKLLVRNRPKCKNVQALVSDEPGEAIFREFGGDLCGHSGLLRSRDQQSWLKLLVDHPNSEYVDHTLPVRVLPDILKEHQLSSAVDLFILDVEGEELNILGKLNLESTTVRTWIVESNKINRDTLDTIMGRWGYACVHKQINSFCKGEDFKHRHEISLSL